MSTPTITAELVEPLRQSLSASAQILLPSDPSFSTAADSWNFDFRTAQPTAAVLPATTADVAATVQFLRAHRLPFTVGCGLHSRYSKRDGHVLLYLGLMRRVTVDVTDKVARVQGGARNEDLDRAGGACVPPLHVVAGTNPDTGVGGLILGGGVGYLSRRQGLTIDNLLEVELVTAEGEVVRASETMNPDLFWAVRGAGFNMGIVTEFVLRVYDDVGHQMRELTEDDEMISTKHGLPEQEQLKSKVLQGMLPYPRPMFKHIASVLQAQYMEPGKAGPMGDRSLYLGLIAANTPMGPAAVVSFVYYGDAYRGHEALDKLVEALGAPLAPVHVAVKMDTYVALQHMLDKVTLPGYYYERTYMAASMSDDFSSAVLASAEALSDFPGCSHSVLVCFILGVDGAIQENEGRGAFSAEQRRGNILLGTIGHWDPTEAPDARGNAIAWANKARELVMPHCLTVYTNSVSGHAGSKVTFGSSLERLRRIKQQWDPSNVFCNNQNIVPADLDEDSSQTALPDFTS